MTDATDLPFLFDFRKPDYNRVLAWRLEKLKLLRAHPEDLPAIREFYRENPAAFITHWGNTSDPRNVQRGLPALVPFILYPKQRELIDWILERWRGQEPGLIEKSRDSGASWLMVALACTLCLFNRDLVIGFGSRKEIYVDEKGSPRALLEKARNFLAGIPAEFLQGWDRERHAPNMRILFPATSSTIVGEAGDGIGRGDRASMYVIDEAAFLERPDLIDASLSATTDCRIDVSTPNGRANSFASKRFSGRIKVWTMHWRDDPRKGDDWYRRQVETLDPVSLAQEVDIDYNASVEGVVIPSAWIQSAIDAHTRLGIKVTGWKYAGLDVADEGIDKCALAGRRGILLEHLTSWTGKGSNIYLTVAKAFHLCDDWGYPSFHYDADGLGSGVRGAADILNEKRGTTTQRQISAYPFRGSGSPHDPEGEMVPQRKNGDFFLNLKAHAWWHLRRRFEETHRVISNGLPVVDPDAIISIDPQLPELEQLVSELSQPTWSVNNSGKVQIDKKPDGAKSPDLADAVVIAFQPGMNSLETWALLGTANASGLNAWDAVAREMAAKAQPGL